MSSVDRDAEHRHSLRRSHAASSSTDRVRLQVPCTADDATLLAGVAAGLAPSDVDAFAPFDRRAALSDAGLTPSLPILAHVGTHLRRHRIG